jgi:Rne/Rng family ribonuclease
MVEGARLRVRISLIVINQTEALVAIDVNTGKCVGKSNRLEDTIVKANTDAAKEIVRQTRLRDLGGIIVVDFIDMDESKNRQKVMQALEESMRQDRAPYKILQFKPDWTVMPVGPQRSQAASGLAVTNPLTRVSVQRRKRRTKPAIDAAF